MIDVPARRASIPTPAAAAAVVRGVAAKAGVALVDVVPGAASVLVVAGSQADRDRLVAVLPTEWASGGGTRDGGDPLGAGSAEATQTVQDPTGAGSAEATQTVEDLLGVRSYKAPRTVEVPVRYDGEDLAAVAQATKLTVAEVVRRHSERTYRAAFTGFAPGFAYLTGLDPSLRLPRRATFRPAVPAGSVAIADGYTAVYPRPSPGGWHLLGTTSAVMFYPGRPRPALVAPGDWVCFVVDGDRP